MECYASAYNTHTALDFCHKAKSSVAVGVEPSGREVCLSLTMQLHLAGPLFDHRH